MGVSHRISVSLSVVCVSWGMSIFSVCVSRQMKHSLAEGCNIIGMIEKFADILACFSCFTLHFVKKNQRKRIDDSKHSKKGGKYLFLTKQMNYVF